MPWFDTLVSHYRKTKFLTMIRYTREQSRITFAVRCLSNVCAIWGGWIPTSCCHKSVWCVHPVLFHDLSGYGCWSIQSRSKDFVYALCVGNQAWWQQMDLTAALLVSAAAVWRVDKRIISREFDYAYYVFPSRYWAPLLTLLPTQCLFRFKAIFYSCKTLCLQKMPQREVIFGKKPLRKSLWHPQYFVSETNGVASYGVTYAYYLLNPFCNMSSQPLCPP